MPEKRTFRIEISLQYTPGTLDPSPSSIVLQFQELATKLLGPYHDMILSDEYQQPLRMVCPHCSADLSGPIFKNLEDEQKLDRIDVEEYKRAADFSGYNRGDPGAQGLKGE